MRPGSEETSTICRRVKSFVEMNECTVNKPAIVRRNPNILLLRHMPFFPLKVPVCLKVSV